MPLAFQRILLLLACAPCFTACPSGAELEGAQNWAPTSTEFCDPTPIFETECAGGACHGSDRMMTPLGGVNLIAPGVNDRLIDQPAAYPTLNDPNCPTDAPELLVSSVEQSRSLLLTKLNGEHACGAAMPIPREANYLSDDDIECITSYIKGLLEAQTSTDGNSAPDGGNGGSSASTAAPNAGRSGAEP